MPGTLWKMIEAPESIPRYLGSKDRCLYAMDYTAGGGFQASPANSQIFNLKKAPALRDTDTLQWSYKLQAIRSFARDLLQVFDEGSRYAIAAIPTSKSTDDAEYDSRLDDVISRVKSHRPDDIIVMNPLVCAKSHKPKHLTGREMTPDEVYSHLGWRGFAKPPSSIILIDDVITHGAHFAACKRMIQENHPHTNVRGVFWAKTILS